MVKERPILFSAPMVRAILAGAKCHTRRIAKPQPPSVEAVRAKAGDGYHLSDAGAPGMWRVMGPVWAVRELMAGNPVDARARADVGPQWRCPYGVPGDRLWVKEGHAIRADVDPKVDLAKARQYLIYRADHDGDLGMEWHSYGRWRPSIHMPRWASRITLEIAEVRVQRLQAISTLDAMAEGVEPRPNAAGVLSYTTGFHRLWDEINGERRLRVEEIDEGGPTGRWRTVIDRSAAWESNPWVWALTFKRVEQPR